MLNQNFFAELSELICTRISHDLIGNIGAVANAVELMDEDPEAIDDAKSILSISSKVLTARLKFFRLAFGLNNTGVKTIAEITAPAEEYIATVGSRTAPIKLNFNISTPALYKIVMLGIMVMSDVFIRGGELSISETVNGLTFTADSQSALSAGKLAVMQKVLNAEIPAENPAQSAPLIYMMRLLNDTPVKITVSYTEKQAVLQIA
ncbi:MAG: hypothetical protein SO141_03415 [Alphaproteobacteria bacterium]|nr:hypothetical protein [Alphaproteobacteria bacterium]